MPRILARCVNGASRYWKCKFALGLGYVEHRL